MQNELINGLLVGDKNVLHKVIFRGEGIDVRGNNPIRYTRRPKYIYKGQDYECILFVRRGTEHLTFFPPQSKV